MFTQLQRSAQILLLPLLIGLTGCENHNLFSKVGGTSNDPATLNAQASIALRNKDFSKAVELADKVLASDPNNSDALYNKAAALMGGAGLNLGLMISNVLKQVDSANASSVSIHGLPDLMASARGSSVVNTTCGTLNSILAGINCDSLNQVIDGVVANLQKIASGQAHGTIKSTDVPMLIDLAIIYVLRAALKAASGDYLQFTNNGGSFEVEAGANLNTLCTTNSADAIFIVKNVARAYRVLHIVSTLLGLSDTSIIQQVRNDIKDAGDQLFTRGADQILPDACYDNVFDMYDPPLTQATYLSVFQSTPFQD